MKPSDIVSPRRAATSRPQDDIRRVMHHRNCATAVDGGAVVGSGSKGGDSVAFYESTLSLCIVFGRDYH